MAKLKKIERLCHKKSISETFEHGHRVKKYPLITIYHPEVVFEDQYFPQVLFTVPKRNFKSAVKRNRIRRQMREAYRLNKHILTNNTGSKALLLPRIIFIFTARAEVSYQDIETATTDLLKRAIKNRNSQLTSP